MSTKSEAARLAADLNPESDPHARFRDLCLVYGDFYREEFMQEIERFLGGASKAELEAVRAAIAGRVKRLRGQRRRRGRPAAGSDADWLERGRRIAWWRIIERRTWPVIAKRLEMQPTKPNLRTLQRWLHGFADVVAKALPGAQPLGTDAEVLERKFTSREVQFLLARKTGLPFRTHPDECGAIVRNLYASAIARETGHPRAK